MTKTSSNKPWKQSKSVLWRDLRGKIAGDIKLNEDDIIRAFKAVVRKRGKDYVYYSPKGNGYSCMNTHPVDPEIETWIDTRGSKRIPGCAIGYMMAELYGIERIPVYGAVDDTIHAVGGNGHFTANAMLVMRVIQDVQDSHRPYGFVLEKAQEHVREMQKR